MPEDKILTDQVTAEITAALTHYGLAIAKRGEGCRLKEDDRVFLGYKPGKGDVIWADLDLMSAEEFGKANHHSRAKRLRKIVGKSINVLREKGVL